MNLNDILSKVDHTLLSLTATYDEIINVCDEGLQYGVASVCIPPCYVKTAKEYVKNRVKVCTVIGFPNGYSTTETKLFETLDSLEHGADEIDMVINLGLLKDGRYGELESEIKKIKNICGDRILKVIIETCLLTQEEKIRMCKVITDSGADYIKTSTGFSKFGAKIEDIILFGNYIGENVKIKAAGGISDLKDAENFIRAGASRLGTSKIVKLAQNI